MSFEETYNIPSVIILFKSHHTADREGVTVSALWTRATDAPGRLSGSSKFPWLAGVKLAVDPLL